MRLEGKVTLISGAARGQGETEARLFAQEGASVVLGDILKSEGEAAAAAIGEGGGDARFIALDVTSEADWVSAIRFTVERSAGWTFSSTTPPFTLANKSSSIRTSRSGDGSWTST